MEGGRSTDSKTANYLVTNYEDLIDVVGAIEKLIAQNAESVPEENLRKSVQMSIIPLKGKRASIFKIRLHDAMKA